MSETPRRARRIPRLGRGVRTILAGALVLLAALIVLWVVRKPVATHVIDRELARGHVPARYTLTDLGIGHQRLTDVVIGDPAHPDLVADWIETETQVGLSGAVLTGIKAGRIRLRGRLVGAQVSLGAIDRLLPAPSGKPFALPPLALDLADARMRLETSAGAIGLKLAGAGRLDGGFAGRLAVVSDRLAANGCVADQVAMRVRIQIADAAPHVAGPVHLGALACGATRVAGAGSDIDATLGPALDRWRGQARLATGMVTAAAGSLASLAGTIGVAGTAAATQGRIDVTGAHLATAAGTAARVALAGDYRITSGAAFAGRVEVTQAAAAANTMRALASWQVGRGTPAAPLAVAVSQALAAAGRNLSGSGEVALRYANGRGAARLSRLALTAASGARATIIGGSGIAFGWPEGGVRFDTVVAIAGGGVPDARIALAQARTGAPIRGTMVMAPYSAGDARLVLTPVRVTAIPGGATRIATTVSLSGPLAGGRIDGVTLPVQALWNGGSRLIVNPGCAPLSVAHVAVAGLTLRAGRAGLCPLGGALLRLDGDRLGGGVRIAGVRLQGRLGSIPIDLAAAGAAFRLGDPGFTLDGVATRLGTPERETRLTIAHLDGGFGADGMMGRFAGAGGRIANVPLLLADAAGLWTLKRGALALTGTLGVSDAAPAARFQPLVARQVTLALADGAITAKGTLYEPTRNVKVADVTIAHALGSGRGRADLAVPGLAFGKDFQPDLLTRLTFGVIAEVAGTVDGAGRIAWSPDGVTSSGDFGTRGIDLAAAFGPVTGIAGRIAFTDLLALASAPGQVAAVRTINPGIPVSDGRITYQTLPNSRIQVERGVWPFAGGSLTLDPTLLDFAAPQARRLTFRVTGAAADQFLQQFDFQNLDATGTFDGVLPMVFDLDGGTIRDGRIAVRAGGGTLAYVGDLSQKDLGFWSNIAFGALKSLRYRSLAVVMNGPLAGEMVTEVRFAGISQGAGAKSNFLIRRLQKLPFVFNIRIRAPFRGLLDSAQSFYDPSRLIQRNLPALLRQQQSSKAAPGAVQPPASEIVP